MSVIYLVSHGGRMRRENDRFVYESHSGMREIFFPHETEQIVMIGRVEISSSVLNLLMKWKIETVFLSFNGIFNGKLEFQKGPNVFLRRKQYSLLDNHDFCRKFSRSIVSVKVHNELSFMQRIRRNIKNDSEESIGLDKNIALMKNLTALIDRADSIEALRGLEGSGARYYFSMFQYIFLPDWAVFRGRNKHPPKDNVNAVLSFLYTLILNRVATACNIEGLDPYCGYFHVLDYGKQTLVFDLMEEYRTILADRLAVSLFNKGMLEEDDFRDQKEKDMDLEDEKAVLLSQTGLQKVIRAFEKEMDRQIYYESLQRPVSYKKIILEQAKQLKRVIGGEQKEYYPIRMER